MATCESGDTSKIFINWNMEMVAAFTYIKNQKNKEGNQSSYLPCFYLHLIGIFLVVASNLQNNDRII